MNAVPLTLILNGVNHRVEADPNEPMLRGLRIPVAPGRAGEPGSALDHR